MLLFYTKPVITFQSAQAGKITAKAIYSVSCGNREYRMEISRYTSLNNVRITCFKVGNSRAKDEQFSGVKKTGKGYFAIWRYRGWGDKSTRIYLPDEFQSIYEWGDD